jgi:hypothetical protein
LLELGVADAWVEGGRALREALAEELPVWEISISDVRVTARSGELLERLRATRRRCERPSGARGKRRPTT